MLLATALVMSGCAGNTAAESQPETGAAFGGETVITGGRDAEGTNGVIAAGREDAARIGMDIMKAGGNAIDAACAIGFALGVCEQQSSGIGGGGFMTVRFGETGEVVFIDFRDRAGKSASLDQWTILEDGTVKDQENKIGAKAVAVPGEVKGMLYALDHYGTMSRQQVIHRQRAIRRRRAIHWQRPGPRRSSGFPAWILLPQKMIPEPQAAPRSSRGCPGNHEYSVYSALFRPWLSRLPQTPQG